MERTILGTYLAQVRRYPLLSAEQEKQLAMRIRQGDIEAKMRLVNSNLRLVVKIAKKYASGGIDMMDLIQEGNLGLMTAAGKFRCSFNTRFTTYAHPWIMQYMLRYIQSKTAVVSIPFRKEELLRTIKKTEALLAQQIGRKVTCRDIAVYLDIPEEKVRSVKQIDFSCFSMNDELKGMDGLTFADTIVDDRFSVEQEFLRGEESLEVQSLLDSLPWRERQVIRYRYNLCNSGGPKTLRQIGAILGVTSETVRQLELKALVRLRKEATRLPV